MNFDRIFANRVTAILLALVTCLLWGSLFPMIKIGYAAFQIGSGDVPSIILFAGLRFTVSGILMILLFSVTQKHFLLPKKKELLPVLVTAAFTIILHYVLTYTALSLGEGSKSAIIKQVGFLFLSCFSFLFVKSDRFTCRKLACGILGFLGIIVTSLDGGGFQFALGDALLIAASFCSVAGTVVTKKATRSVSPLLLVSYSQFFGGLVLSATGLCLGGKITVFDAGAFASFAYICAASIVAYAIWNLLLKYNSLSMLSVIKFSEPLFAVILSGLLLGESIFRLNYLFAFIIILAAILINNLKIRRKQNEKNTASR